MNIINNLNSNDICFNAAKFSVRLLAASDRALYRQLFCSKQVMQWIGEPLTEIQVNASFVAAVQHNIAVTEELQQGSRIFLIIEDRVSNSGQGLMAVTFNLAQCLTAYIAEIGIMLLPSAQRKGLARGAFGSLCQKLQQLSTVNAIVCNIAEHNLAAKKLVSGLGFVYCKRRCCYKLKK